MGYDPEAKDKGKRFTCILDHKEAIISHLVGFLYSWFPHLGLTFTMT
jgi:hypothetical protein